MLLVVCGGNNLCGLASFSKNQFYLLGSDDQYVRMLTFSSLIQTLVGRRR